MFLVIIMTTLTRVEQLTAIQKEANELFSRKNADYGDAFAAYGTIGILVRLGDKIQRLQSITSKGINLVDDENLRDTLIDLHNYAAMGIMLLDEAKEPANETVNKTIDEWLIKGVTNTYKRQLITHFDGKVEHNCSCPSFKYCHGEVKSCKHINSEYDKVDSTES
jgi:hypothetical protein